MQRLLISTLFSLTLLTIFTPFALFAQSTYDPDSSTPFNESYFNDPTTETIDLDTSNDRYRSVVKSNYKRKTSINCLSENTDILPGFTKQTGQYPYPNMRPGGITCNIYPIDADTFSVYRKNNSLIMTTYYRSDTGQTFYFYPPTRVLKSEADMASLSGGLPYHQFLDQQQGIATSQPPSSPATATLNDADPVPCIEDPQTDGLSGGTCTTKFSRLPNPLGGAGINTAGDAVDKITTILMIIAVPFVTIMIMYAGFCYIAAFGNPEKIRAANKRALWTLVGTLLLFGAATIGNLIIKTIQKVTTDGIPQTSTTTTSSNTPTTTNNQQATSTQQLPNPNTPTKTTPTTTTTTPSGSQKLTISHAGNDSTPAYNSPTTGEIEFSFSYDIDTVPSNPETVTFIPFLQIVPPDNIGTSFYELNQLHIVKIKPLVVNVTSTTSSPIKGTLQISKSELIGAGAPSDKPLTLRLQVLTSGTPTYYDDNVEVSIDALNKW